MGHMHILKYTSKTNVSAQPTAHTLRRMTVVYRKQDYRSKSSRTVPLRMYNDLWEHTLKKKL